MSLMAGFDIIFELSNETVLKLITSSVMFEGQKLAQPFEISIPLSGGVQGTAHLICSDVTLSLEDTDHVVLLLAFRFMTVVTTSPLRVEIGPLAGTIRIASPLAVVEAGITVDMPHADVSFMLDAHSANELDADLAGQIITPAGFMEIAKQTITALVHAQPSANLPMPFKVVPGVNGVLYDKNAKSDQPQPIQLEALEVHCIGDSDPKRQSLGLFGTLLVAHHGQGHHGDRTTTAISSTADGVAISLSPSAFEELIFKPEAAKIDMGDGVQIDSMTASFGDSVINVDTAASKSGPCYDAHATLHSVVTLTASGTTVTPKIDLGEPDIEVDIPWYCYVATAVLLGPLGVGLVATMDAVLDAVARSLMSLPSAMRLDPIHIGNDIRIIFSHVDITPEGLTIQGRMPMEFPSSGVTSALYLEGSVMTTSSVQVGTGAFAAHTLCTSEQKMYDYTETQQQQRGLYQLTSRLTILPLTPMFSVRFATQTYPLTGTHGTLAIPNVKTRYMMPMAGGSEVTQTVHLTYNISGTQVVLTNVPTEGNYLFQLDVEARDINGNAVTDLSGAVLRTSAEVMMEGDHVSAPEWEADVQECLQNLLNAYKKKLRDDRHKHAGLVPSWPPVNHPAIDDLLAMIRGLVSLELPEADQMLLHARMAHGRSFYQALLSPQARKGVRGVARKS